MELAEHMGLVKQVFFFFLLVRCSSLTLPCIPTPNFIFFIFVYVYPPPLIMLGFIDMLEFRF